MTSACCGQVGLLLLPRTETLCLPEAPHGILFILNPPQRANRACSDTTVYSMLDFKCQHPEREPLFLSFLLFLFRSQAVFLEPRLLLVLWEHSLTDRIIWGKLYFSSRLNRAAFGFFQRATFPCSSCL